MWLVPFQAAWVLLTSLCFWCWFPIRPLMVCPDSTKRWAKFSATYYFPRWCLHVEDCTHFRSIWVWEHLCMIFERLSAEEYMIKPWLRCCRYLTPSTTSDCKLIGWRRILLTTFVHTKSFVCCHTRKSETNHVLCKERGVRIPRSPSMHITTIFASCALELIVDIIHQPRI